MKKSEVVIYLIDDDELTNHIHEKILHVWSQGRVEVKAFVQAKEVLDLLKQDEPTSRPDYIFLDLNMPVMDGWEFLREYEKLHIDIPVYVLSSSIQYSDKSRAISHPSVADYLTKPLKLEILEELDL